ncbi:MAG: DUF262 domain-containing protein [Clostridiales bacterium]|nr:DUF262 domain-containing protein [Clostridiales bacterium]
MRQWSLYELLKNYSICIPAIQREYVQGFNDEFTRGIRTQFLEDILRVLEDENKHLKINIIYGYCKDRVFFPIDGQQRLTTLYLLHWFLWVKSGDKENSYVHENSFSYEIRESVDSFFQELSSKDRYAELQDILNQKDFFSESIIKKLWFKSIWLNDATVMASLNVIEELKEKVTSKEDARVYYKGLKEGRIYFDFAVNQSQGAKRSSVEDYFKLNSRGKQLGEFDNTKALLYTLEKKLGVPEEMSFANGYDTRYIDIFYDLNIKNNQSLEELTEEMDKTTLNYLINMYNVLLRVFEEPNTMKPISSFMQYRIFIKNAQYADDLKEKTFLIKYLEFLNNTLQTIFILDEDYSKKILKKLCADIIEFESGGIEIEENITILFYCDTYYRQQKKTLTQEYICKFEYVLFKNLAYRNWEGYDWIKGYHLCEKIALYEDIIEYFYEKNEKEIISECTYEVQNKLLPDINRRIKEQKIKIRICKTNKLKYDYFNYLEEVRCEKRSIYFLLFFADIWDDLSDENLKNKFNQFKEYVAIATQWFESKTTLELRQRFALSTYYDQESNQFLPCDTINEKANYVYIIGKNEKGENILDNKNLHYWSDDYYFISDNLSETDAKLRQLKLGKLKLAYDWERNRIKNNSHDAKHSNEWKKVLNNVHYQKCWLALAIERGEEEVLTRKLRFKDGVVEILIEIPYQRYNSTPKYINFFAYIYLKDKEKEGSWSINQFTSLVYDLSSKNTRDTISYQNYIDYDSCNNRKIMNVSELHLIWEKQNIGYIPNRSFLYSKHTIYIKGEGKEQGNVLISLEGDTVVKRVFHLGKEPREFYYNFREDRRKIEEKRAKEEQVIQDIYSAYSKYKALKIDNEEETKRLEQLKIEDENYDEMSLLRKEIMESKKEFERLLKENYTCKNSYTRNGEYISKYLYVDTFKKQIGNELYKE